MQHGEKAQLDPVGNPMRVSWGEEEEEGEAQSLNCLSRVCRRREAHKLLLIWARTWVPLYSYRWAGELCLQQIDSALSFPAHSSLSHHQPYCRNEASEASVTARAVSVSFVLTKSFRRSELGKTLLPF